MMKEHYYEDWMEFITTEFTYEQIKEINCHGFNFAAPNDWIYYEGSTEFYNDNMEYLEQVFEDVCFNILDKDVPTMINELGDGNCEFHNVKQSIIIFLVELACQDIVSSEEDYNV